MSERARPISAAAGRRQVSVACEAFNAEVAVPQNATANIEGFIAPGPSVRSACRITGLALDRFSMNVNLSHDRAHPTLGLPFCPAGTASVSLPLALPLVQHLFRDAALAGLVHVLAVPRRLLTKAMRRPADAHWPDQLA